MTDHRMPSGTDRLQRLHRARKVMSWVVLIALSLALISVAYGGATG